MQVRFLSKLSLFITILVLPQFITSNHNSQSLLCSTVLAAEAETLGEPGYRGETGAKGENGRNSDNLTVFADGSSMTLDLTGGHGAAGEQGIKGEAAFCEQQTEDVGKNLRGADGGNGGDGGDGGVGGNGGSLTVYATNKEHLKQIYVIAAGEKEANLVAREKAVKAVNAIALTGMKKLALANLEALITAAQLKNFSVLMVIREERAEREEKGETARLAI